MGSILLTMAARPSTRRAGGGLKKLAENVKARGKTRAAAERAAPKQKRRV